MYFRKRLLGRYAVIFLYHRVCPKEESVLNTNICPEDFEKQVRYLRKYFHICTLEDLVEDLNDHHLNNKKLGNIAVITFDDGYRDNYIYAYPILKKYNIPATIFLTSDYIGKDNLFWWDKIVYIIYHSKKEDVDLENFGSFSLTNNNKKLECIHFLTSEFKNLPFRLRNKYILDLQNKCHVNIPSDIGKKMVLSWNEIREMNDNGISFGAHTLSHANLISLNLAEAKNEIVQSKAMIEDKLKSEIISFAYPYGSRFYNNDIMRLVQNAGYLCAVKSSGEIIDQSKSYNHYSLPRFSVGDNYCSFTIRASGMLTDFYKIFHSR